MKRIYYYLPILLIGFTAVLSSCSDSKTYAQLLDDEKKAIKNFISLTNDSLKFSETINVSAAQLEEYTAQASWDSIDNKHFELNKWYKFEDGLYMRINSFGDTSQMFKSRDGVVIRYWDTYNLLTYTGSDSKKINNLADDSYWLIDPWTVNYSGQFGTGIAFPIRFLGDKGEVSLIIPSKLGTTNDAQAVVPYYYGSVSYILPGN